MIIDIKYIPIFTSQYSEQNVANDASTTQNDSSINNLACSYLNYSAETWSTNTLGGGGGAGGHYHTSRWSSISALLTPIFGIFRSLLGPYFMPILYQFPP